MTHRIFNSLGAPLSLEVNILILVNSKMKLGILGFSRSLITILITKNCQEIELTQNFRIFTNLMFGNSLISFQVGFQVRFETFSRLKIVFRIEIKLS